MKRFLLALALGVSLSGAAQVFNVGQVEKLSTPADPTAKVVAISPQGDYVLLSDDQNAGLTKFDLTTGDVVRLTDALGAGYDVKISADGQDVVYRETTFNDRHLRYSSLQAINLPSGEKRELVAATRNLEGYAVANATAAAVNGGKLQKRALGKQKPADVPVLSIKNRQLMITRNGKTQVFSPNGEEYSYLWESISPDGTKALYYVCGVGAFVCDLDGGNIIALGMMRAPQWYDDNTVIGMLDTDNGVYYTSSVIKAATLDGKTQTLTDDSQIAMYPVAAQGKIVFSTPYGESYLIHVSK